MSNRKHGFHCIQWIIGHPILFAVGRHRKTHTVKPRVLLNKRAKALGLQVFLGLYFHWNDVAVALQEEVNLAMRRVGRPIVYGQAVVDF